eukprot:299319-Prymnesium_polylepis.1
MSGVPKQVGSVTLVSRNDRSNMLLTSCTQKGVVASKQKPARIPWPAMCCALQCLCVPCGRFIHHCCVDIYLSPHALGG